jgi:hypothetical protein
LVHLLNAWNLTFGVIDDSTLAYVLVEILLPQVGSNTEVLPPYISFVGFGRAKHSLATKKKVWR